MTQALIIISIEYISMLAKARGTCRRCQVFAAEEKTRWQFWFGCGTDGAEEKVRNEGCGGGIDGSNCGESIVFVRKKLR